MSFWTLNFASEFVLLSIIHIVKTSRYPNNFFKTFFLINKIELTFMFNNEQRNEQCPEQVLIFFFI